MACTGDGLDQKSRRSNQDDRRLAVKRFGFAPLSQHGDAASFQPVDAGCRAG